VHNISSKAKNIAYSEAPTLKSDILVLVGNAIEANLQ
jgi:hypothetical protein